MSKFNESAKGINLTTNRCGESAYKMGNKLKIATMVITSLFGEKKYYGDNTNELVVLAKELIKDNDGQYIANLAVFARKEMHLRSVAQALCAILAGEVNGKEFVKYAVNGVIERADDITEILSCYLSMYGKPIANSLKKALANAMNKFDEYSFAKYNKDSKMKFGDILKITHAKAKDEAQNQIFKAILNGELKTPYTWETEISTKGNNKETWENLIESEKVGTMAILRNLNNILEANPKNIDKALDILKNEKKILKSKILQFRFFSAYKVLQENNNCSSKIMDTIEIALRNSTKNIERLNGKTLIAVDVSGSMDSRISNGSDVRCSDISRLIGSMANYICEDSIVVAFDNDLYKYTFSSLNGIISNANTIQVMGGGTSISLPIQYLLNTKSMVDRIIIISDNESNCGIKGTCQSVLNLYKKEINKNVWVHAIDLQGYGTQQFCGENVNIIAGWNEKIFDFIHLAEQGFDNMVNLISNYNEMINNDKGDEENVDIDTEI